MPVEVDCESVERQIVSGQGLDSEPVRAHLASCEACSVLHRDGGALAQQLAAAAETGPSSEELLGKTQNLLAAETTSLAGRLRSLATSRRYGMALALCGLLWGLTAVLTLRADWALYPTSRMLLALTTLGLVGLLIVEAALAPLDRRQRRMRSWALLVLGLSLPVALGSLPMAHGAHPASLGGVGEALVPRAVACLLWGSAVVVPLLALLHLMDRFAGVSLFRSALVAVSAGAAGNLALQLHCPLTNPAHLLLGHATVGVLLIAVYLGWSRLQARWRNQTA